MTCRQSQPWPTAPDLASFAWHDPQWMALHNRLHRRREKSSALIGGQSISVLWTGSAQPLAVVTEVLLTLGDAPFKLRVPSQLLTQVGLPDFAETNPLAGAILLELTLLALIEPFELLTGRAARVVEALDLNGPERDAPDFVLSMLMEVQIDQNPTCAVQLHMTASGGAWFANQLDRHVAAAPDQLQMLRLPLKVEAGEAWLSLAELRSLQPGDVVMLDTRSDGSVRLLLDEHMQARAALDGHTLTLLEQPTGVNPMEEQPMNETGTGPGLDTHLDDLPLKLVCQAGSVELSLAQLRELGVGSLLALTPGHQDGVELMVNGRRVGHGQLVKIGDGLGVRLLGFATP